MLQIASIVLLMVNDIVSGIGRCQACNYVYCMLLDSTLYLTNVKQIIWAYALFTSNCLLRVTYSRRYSHICVFVDGYDAVIACGAFIPEHLRAECIVEMYKALKPGKYTNLITSYLVEMTFGIVYMIYQSIIEVAFPIT